MSRKKPGTKPDFLPVTDRGEHTTLMEPLVLSSQFLHRSELLNLCLELVAKSSAFKSRLPSGVLTALSNLVRKMNCYYSNLIEGHDTHPIEIERALNNDYSHDKNKRDLQQEATAHVIVQEWIDSGGVAGRSVAKETILEIHKRFCDNLPEDLLWVEDHETGELVAVESGKVRVRDVEVGRHVVISPGAVPQ